MGVDADPVGAEPALVALVVVNALVTVIGNVETGWALAVKAAYMKCENKGNELLLTGPLGN